MLEVLKRYGVIACINLLLCGPVALAEQVQTEKLTSGVGTLPMLGLLFDAPAAENRRYEILGYWDGSPETSVFGDVVNVFDTRGDIFLSRTYVAVNQTSDNACADFVEEAAGKQYWSRTASFWGSDWTMRQGLARHPTNDQDIPMIYACRDIGDNQYLYIRHVMAFEALGLSQEEGAAMGALNVAPEDAIRQLIETAIIQGVNTAVNQQTAPGIRSLTERSTYINGDRSAAARTITIPGLNKELQLPDDGYLWYAVSRDGRPYLTRWLPVFPKVDIEIMYRVGSNCDFVLNLKATNPIDVPAGLPGEWYAVADDEGDTIRTVACRRVDSGALGILISMPGNKLHIRDLEPVIVALTEALN